MIKNNKLIVFEEPTPQKEKNMAKEKDKIQLQVLDELCTKTITSINAAHHYIEVMDQTEKVRETAMVKTKLDEALLWIKKYHYSVMDSLTIKQSDHETASN